MALQSTPVIAMGTSNFGDVFGPSSSTDNAVPRFDGTTGKLLQNSTVIIADDGSVLVPSTSTEALLITKAGDTGDVVGVNTTVPGLYASGSGTLLVTYMVGGTTVTPSMSVVTGTNNANSVYANIASTTTSAQNRFVKARGTQSGLVDVLNGDGVMSIIADAYAGGAFRIGASMQFTVDTGTISATSMPMYLRINTTPDGSVASLTRLQVGSSGDISIGRGEKSASAATGGIVRAPDNITGGAGNIAAADITFSGGLGTGTGDPSQVIFRVSSVAAAGDNLQTRSTVMVLDGDSTAAVTITPPSLSSGLPRAVLITPGTNTGVTASTDNPQFVFATSTQTWATGAITQANYVKFSGPTFAAAASSAISIAASFWLDKSPIQGTNADIDNSVAYLVGDPINSVTSAVNGNVFGIVVVPEGIDNGIGAVTGRTGIHVTGSNGQVSLGNQTATLDYFYGISVEGISLVSTTNTRTVTNAASNYVGGAPSNGGNVAFTNGPYAYFADDGLSRFDGGLAIDGSTTKNVASGVYTPTRSAEVNMDANVTMTEAQYMRLGNTVTVSGRFTADPTLTATATSFEISLPVASNFGAAEDAAGTAFCGTIAGMGAEVIGVAANDTAKIQWVSSDITSKVWSFVFVYQII